jgi:hypothetical protein
MLEVWAKHGGECHAKNFAYGRGALWSDHSPMILIRTRFERRPSNSP